MRVYCYKNLTTGRWSLADKPKHKIDDRETVILRDVTFKVYENQRQWCLSNRLASGKPYRQVHAYAVGEVVETAPAGVRVPVSYNPERGGSFYRKDTGKDIQHCEYVEFNAHGAFAVGIIN